VALIGFVKSACARGDPASVSFFWRSRATQRGSHISLRKWDRNLIYSGRCRLKNRAKTESKPKRLRLKIFPLSAWFKKPRKNRAQALCDAGASRLKNRAKTERKPKR
jgi:hypothetical protein